MSWLRRCALLVLVVGVTLGGLPATTAFARPTGSLASVVPVNGTPHVLNGKVLSIAQVGGTMVLGGEFTQARNNGSTQTLARANLLAFDATTGQISTTFVPNPNGPVNVVLPAGDGTSVYVGGSFTSIAGEARKNLVRLDVSSGAVLPGFNPGKVAGQVKDLRLSGGRLWVAGAFTHIANNQQAALATLNPATGALSPFFRGVVTGTHNGGYTTVSKIDVTPSGDRLVAIGNFTAVNGSRRWQLAVLDLTGATAGVADLSTSFYETKCSASFDSYMRDLDVSPDGSFFVVSTTGAYGGAGTACDSTARFETRAAGAVSPSWVNNTGGDTTYAVEITDSVVYTGGHARWQNNPFKADTPGQGAVARPGIAALDPANGLPYSWNPTRTRGVGVFDLLVTGQGLWVGSDTDRIGASYLRSRIALLPPAGATFPLVEAPGLPNDVYAATTTGLVRRAYAGGGFGTAQQVPGGGIAWANVKGAFMLDGWLYVAWSNGTMDRRRFDGTSYGTAQPVNASDQLTVLTDWRSDIQTATSMFFDGGRIYFTKAGTASLFYRYFTPESGVVGARRLTASANVTGLDLTQVRGMTAVGDHLYWSTTSGDLRRTDWRRGAQSGSPVAGTTVVVSGPAVDQTSWGTPRSLFLFQDAEGDGAPQTPQPAFDQDCTSLTCEFDGTGSSVAGNASITDWAWDFGDGGTGTGATPDHTFPATGAYQVRLTVTSSKGATATLTKEVRVERVNAAPTADFAASCQALTCTLDAGSSSDPDGELADYSWQLGGGQTASGRTVTHTFDAGGTHEVVLTVTDSDGAQSTKTGSVTLTEASVELVGAASTNGNRSQHTVQAPAGTQPGDAMLLFFTGNADTTVTAPEGWTEVTSAQESGIVSRVWSRTAQGGDAGAGVTVQTSAMAKSDLSIAVYRASGQELTVSGTATAARTPAALTTPHVQVDSSAGWLVSYWAVKATGAAALTLPEGQASRATSAGTGSGAVSASLADSGGPVASGSSGGLTASSDVAPSRAVMISVLVRPL
jgi:PKD repeat protein